jgi:hypothetical protein
MNRPLLEQPFAPAQIKQRQGRNGLLDYVEGWSVIARLNEAFEGAWSTTTTRTSRRSTSTSVRRTSRRCCSTTKRVGMW